MELRDYQKLIYDELVADVKSGTKRPLLVLPTGAGKTVIFSYLAKQCLKKSNNVLILVHRRELVKQASDKCKLFNIPHGIIASKFPETDSNVQVASVQTLVRRKNNFIPDVIIIDEAHHVTINNTWSKVLNKYPDAICVGVTATPERLDGKPLGAFFQSLLVGVSIKELVKDGYLAPHIVYAAPNNLDLSKVRSLAGDYNQKDLEEKTLAADIVGDAVEMYRKHANHLPAIAFCVSVKHAEVTCDKFVKAGYKAKVVEGSMSSKERDTAIQGLADGSVEVLCSCNIVSEGTDIPNVAVGILLRKTKSTSLYMQQVGRILRPQPNKTAIVLDHVGNTEEHGFVDDDRLWNLHNGKEQRKKDEKKIRVQTCKVCFATFKPAKVCPVCGHSIIPTKRELTQAEGELKKLDRIYKMKAGDEFIDTNTSKKLVFICYSNDYNIMPFVLNDANNNATYVIGIARHNLQKLATKKDKSVSIDKVRDFIQKDTQGKVKYVEKRHVYSLTKAIRKKDEQREVRNAKTLAELKVIEKKRGYRTGWAYAKYMSRQKHRKYNYKTYNNVYPKQKTNNDDSGWNW